MDQKQELVQRVLAIHSGCKQMAGIALGAMCVTGIITFSGHAGESSVATRLFTLGVESMLANDLCHACRACTPRHASTAPGDPVQAFAIVLLALAIGLAIIAILARRNAKRREARSASFTERLVVHDSYVKARYPGFTSGISPELDLPVAPVRARQQAPPKQDAEVPAPVARCPGCGAPVVAGTCGECRNHVMARDDSIPVEARAVDLLKAGRAREALAIFDGLCDTQPAVAKHHFNKALALYNLQRYAEALHSVEKGLAIDGADEKARKFRAELEKRSRHLPGTTRTADGQ